MHSHICVWLRESTCGVLRNAMSRRHIAGRCERITTSRLFTRKRGVHPRFFLIATLRSSWALLMGGSTSKERSQNLKLLPHFEAPRSFTPISIREDRQERGQFSYIYEHNARHGGQRHWRDSHRGHNQVHPRFLRPAARAPCLNLRVSTPLAIRLSYSLKAAAYRVNLLNAPTTDDLVLNRQFYRKVG